MMKVPRGLFLRELSLRGNARLRKGGGCCFSA